MTDGKYLKGLGASCLIERAPNGKFLRPEGYANVTSQLVQFAENFFEDLGRPNGTMFVIAWVSSDDTPIASLQGKTIAQIDAGGGVFDIDRRMFGTARFLRQFSNELEALVFIHS